jgi:AcrR family transcriptional regulator
MIAEPRTSPGRRRGRPSNRRGVLEAATRVALRDGPGAVTIDAVMTEAEMSRGGVLYHFPSKDALLQALVDQDIDVVREKTGLESGEALSRAQRLRGYHDACTTWPPERGHVALAVALANNPALLRTWAQVQRDLDRADTADTAGTADAGDEPTAATVARLALDGLWFSDLVDAERFTAERRERVVSAILAMASEVSS